MHRIRICITSVLFLFSASASAIQCDRPPTSLDYAFCQDIDLRRMVEEGAQIIQDVWPRLNPEQQRWLRQDQPAWREQTMTACGLRGWFGTISREIAACLRREVSARNQVLRSLVVAQALPPPIQLVPPSPPPPPSEATSPLEPTTSVPPGNLSDPEHIIIAGLPVMLIIVAALIISALIVLFSFQTVLRRARIKRKVLRAVAYFAEVNRSRHFPECHLPINVMSNEFGLLYCSAQLWEMRSRRYASGGRVRIAKGVRIGGYRQYHYRREPEAIARGTLSITNHRIVFTGQKTATVEYRHLLTIENESASIMIYSSQRQTPIMLSFGDAILGATLIRLCADDRIATNRIPDGMNLAAESVKPLGSLCLRVNQTPY